MTKWEEYGLRPSDVSIVGHQLVAICEEMALALVRAAYSSIVREGKDCSTALLDRTGRVIAQAQRIPVQLASLSAVAHSAIAAIGDELPGRDGFILTNDPYSGAQHLNDLILLAPIYAPAPPEGDSALLAWTGSVIHLIDIGGAAAGTQTNAKDIVAEGLRIPPMALSKSDLESGWLRQILEANVRVSDQVLGDIQAQRSAAALGVSRYLDLCRRYGGAVVEKISEMIMDYAERVTRDAISELPDGTYEAEDLVESDGLGGGPFPIRAALRIKDDELTIDLTGTAGQAQGPINCPLAATLSAAYSFVLGFVLGDTVFVNDGCYRSVEVVIPERSLVNPSYPAPVHARTNVANRVYSTLKLAFASIDPDRSMAAGQDTPYQYTLSRLDDNGSYEMITGVMFGGWGGSVWGAGLDGVSSHLSNATNLPVEYEEATTTWYRLIEYSIRDGSEGGGRYRGGRGLRRVYEILAPGGTFSAYTDRISVPPRGLFGGGDGAVGGFKIIRRDEVIPLAPLVTEVPLVTGDVVVLESAGGGGWHAEEDLEEATTGA
ncbi:MAG: hypothetical protein GEU79_11705 [Acidimicrobiia bacterium]|nr:hypothetical protein [Acidimicrobiia bacterium]